MQRLARAIRTSRFLLLLLCAGLAACSVSENVTPPPGTTATALHANTVTYTAIPTRAPTAPPTDTPTRLPVTNPPAATTVPMPTLIAPSPTAVDLAPGVVAYESAITLAAYPYEKFWIEKRDPATNISFYAFDRAAYETAAPTLQAEPKTFRAMILENEYLKVVILPELGGRIYQITHKQSGKNFLYNNHVLKPTRWGLPEQDGWLAAGGIEWAFPKQEHGYEWNAEWNARTERDAQGVSIVLTDSNATDRPRAEVRVTLPAQSAYLAISPRIENPTSQSQRIQFWSNAMLNLGAADSLSPDTHFYLPDDNVWMHSTANEWIPQEFVPQDNALSPVAPVSFSNLAGRDLRVYKNWDNYLGVFAADSARSDLAQAFVGAYNYTTQTGLARVFSPPLTPGVKLFAFGPNFCCRDFYTDDNAEYFEMWGGPNRTFFADDDLILQPGEARAWTEYFVPLPDTNGIGAALPDFAMNLSGDDTHVTITAYAAAPRQGVIVLKQDAREIQRWDIDLAATQQLQAQLEIAERPLQLQLQDRDGNVLLETTVQ
jgi:hypothetical protein